MKKSSIKNFSKSLISASLRGLAVFAVFGFALYAYAVTYPATQPNPVSGVVGLYVGKTPSTYQGGNAGSYETANSYCAAAHTDSHVCTPIEMINTYNHNPAAIAGETDSLWINNGAPAYFSSISNDCLGWSTSGTLFNQPVFGSIWDASNNYGVITTCNNSRAYACCK